VQRVERVEPEAIRLVEEMKELSHEQRWAHMSGIRFPQCDWNEVVGSGDANASIWRRLEQDDLGFADLDLAVTDERHVDVVKTHGAKLVAADAAEVQFIAFAGAIDRLHVLESSGRIAHGVDDRAFFASRLVRLCDGARGVIVVMLRAAGHRRCCQHECGQHRVREGSRGSSDMHAGPPGATAKVSRDLA
jgi:hypothetical protein